MWLPFRCLLEGGNVVGEKFEPPRQKSLMNHDC